MNDETQLSKLTRAMKSRGFTYIGPDVLHGVRAPAEISPSTLDLESVESPQQWKPKGARPHSERTHRVCRPTSQHRRSERYVCSLRPPALTQDDRRLSESDCYRISAFKRPTNLKEPAPFEPKSAAGWVFHYS